MSPACRAGRKWVLPAGQDDIESQTQKPIVEDEQMNRTISTWKRTGAGKLRRGFTLVELLVVITIIGLLVGLIVPAVFGVQASFNRAAVKFEVQALNDAVENYRSKHGDYPPDGSSWAVMEKHLRKAFPNILQSELNTKSSLNCHVLIAPITS